MGLYDTDVRLRAKTPKLRFWVFGNFKRGGER